MNTQDITRMLRELLDRPLEIEADDATAIIDQYDAEFDRVEERLISLVQKHAGLRPTQRGDSPRQRLDSLRLNTAAPGVRKEALRKIRLDNDDRVIELAGPLISALLKRDLAIAELALEEERTERVNEAKSQHRRDGLYHDVAIAADRLHASYGVTYHHWKILSAEQFERIAAVILETQLPTNDRR